METAGPQNEEDLQKVLEAHVDFTAQNQAAESQKESAREANVQYLMAVREFIQSVREREDMTDIQKIAMIAAVESNIENPQAIGETAGHLADMLEKVVPAFSEPDVYAVQVEPFTNDVDIDILKTVGDGLDISDHKTGESTVISWADSEGRRQKFNLGLLRYVAVTPEEVDELPLHEVLSKDDILGKITLVTGEAAVVRLLERLYAERDNYSGYDRERIIRHSADLDLDLSRKSQLIGKDLQEKRSKQVKFIAKTILEIPLDGYEGMSYENMASYAKEKGVTVSEVYAEIESQFKAISDKTGQWLREIRKEMMAEKLGPQTQETQFF